MRLFVTCSTSFGGTVIKIVDRVITKQATTAEDITEFTTLAWSQKIETDSQPFIGDLNGDWLDDIIYTESGVSSQIMVSLQIPSESV